MNQDQRLDQAARALHVAGLSHVPFSVSTQLHPREVARSVGLWKPVMLGATAFALAGIGLVQFQRDVRAPQADAVAAVQSAPVSAPVQAGPDSPTTAVDNDPEFYAWLGSDAVALAMEK